VETQALASNTRVYRLQAIIKVQSFIRRVKMAFLPEACLSIGMDLFPSTALLERAGVRF
jgi:hypothetical protein